MRLLYSRPHRTVLRKLQSRPEGREPMERRRPSTMNTRRIFHACILALGILVVVWIGGLLWGQIDDGNVPSDSAFPLVPPPGIVGEMTTQCGSGGCWREMVIESKSRPSALSVVASMELTPERCGLLNVWTMRRTCVGRVFDGTTEEVKIYVRYDEALSKY